MKWRDLVAELEKAGCRLLHHGSCHDIYHNPETGRSQRFRDSIIADLRRLGVYFGEHRIHLGHFRALSSRLPYAIYYRDKDGVRQVVAVLDLRRSPEWIREQLTGR